MKVLGYDIRLSKITNAIATPSEKSPKSQDKHGKAFSEEVLYRTRQDMEKFRAALNQAESPNPNRTELYRLFKDIMDDAHIYSCIQIRKQAILGALFNVTKNGKVREDKSEQLRSKWFYKFVSLALDSIFYGFSLIHFDDLVEGQFKNIKLVPRHHVKPELGIVVKNPYDMTGEDFLENEWHIGVGEEDDLGLLVKLAPLYILKKNALGCWGEFISGYGSPYRILKTNNRDEEVRKTQEKGLKNLASSSYLITDLDDTLDLVEIKSTDVYMVFNELIQRCNSEASKVILGQVTTQEEKSYKGASAVHERILHSINDADEIFIENVFNYQLIPFLNKRGFKLEGCKVSIEPDDRLSIDQKADIDIKLLDFYDLPEEYILKTYGSPVIKKTAAQDPDVEAIKNKLSTYYK